MRENIMYDAMKMLLGLAFGVGLIAGLALGFVLMLVAVMVF